MKAPERIYLKKRNNLPLEVVRGGEWYQNRPTTYIYGSIEYVRKDAFIEKVINFLNYKLDDVVATRVSDTIIPHPVVKQELIEEFKNYMKGE